MRTEKEFRSRSRSKCRRKESTVISKEAADATTADKQRFITGNANGAHASASAFVVTHDNH